MVASHCSSVVVSNLKLTTSVGELAGEPLHVPAEHASPTVHGLESSHDVPSAAGGFVHAPDEVSQVPATPTQERVTRRELSGARILSSIGRNPF